MARIDLDRPRRSAPSKEPWETIGLVAPGMTFAAVGLVIVSLLPGG